jgi:succinate dehydrogenase / fumarate reductase cytochrome b subunit
MARSERPLSPHLQVYRPQITTILSILHRATGVLLALGALAFAVWLYAVANDSRCFALFELAFASLPGKLALFAFSMSLFYHLFNGLRHLLWDIGWGFEIAQTYLSGYTVLVLSAAATALIWFAAAQGAMP